MDWNGSQWPLGKQCPEQKKPEIFLKVGTKASFANNLWLLLRISPTILMNRLNPKDSNRWLSCKSWVLSFFPKQVYLWIFKKKTGHAGGRAVLCWARIWLCWAHWAGLGVGFGSGGRSALCWARIWLCWRGFGSLGWVGRGIWLSVYGLHCTCLLHVFMMVFGFGWFTCDVWGLCWYHFRKEKKLFGRQCDTQNHCAPQSNSTQHGINRPFIQILIVGKFDTQVNAHRPYES